MSTKQKARIKKMKFLTVDRSKLWEQQQDKPVLFSVEKPNENVSRYQRGGLRP